MHTSNLFKMPVLLALVLPMVENGFGQAAKQLSKEEILELIPRGVDFDPSDHAKLEKLLAQGPVAHEVLGQELLRADNWLSASRIIAIFETSSGDKSVAVRYLNRFLELPLNRNSSMWPGVRSQATAALKKSQPERTGSAVEQSVNPPPVPVNKSTSASSGSVALDVPAVRPPPSRAEVKPDKVEAKPASSSWLGVVLISLLGLGIVGWILRRRGAPKA